MIVDDFEELQGANSSLMDFIRYMFGDELSELSFGDMFHVVADSMLTTFLLFFIAAWILYICVGLGRRGWK